MVKRQEKKRANMVGACVIDTESSNCRASPRSRDTCLLGVRCHWTASGSREHSGIGKSGEKVRHQCPAANSMLGGIIPRG